MSTLVDTAPVTHEAHDELESPYIVRERRNRLGLWLFLFSEVFLFGALFAVRFYLWGNTRPELNQYLGLVTTLILLFSSFFMVWSETAMKNGKRKTAIWTMLLTALFGILFLVGVVGFEWGGELKPTSGKYGAVFYIMTGMHAMHVLSGVILILINLTLVLRGRYSAERHWGIEGMASYWHYVDVVWVFFYPALYLIGSPVPI